MTRIASTAPLTGAPTMIAATSPGPGAARRAGALIAVGVLVTYLAHPTKLLRLPVQTLIKERLHLGPEAAADLLAIVAVAWQLKAIAGALSDQLPLFGSRRRSYLVLSGCAGALAWLFAAAVPERYGPLLVALLLANIAAAAGNTIVGALVVEEGRRHDASSRFSALRVNAMNLAALAAGPAGGWLADRAFAWTSAVGALLMIALAAMALLLLPPKEPTPPGAPATRAMVELRAVLVSRALWGAAALSLFFYVAPGFNAVLYYWQRDVLSLSNAEVGALEAVNSGCSIATVAVLSALTPRLPPRRMLALGIVLYALGDLVYVGYRSWTAAIVIEVVNGVLAAIGLVAVQDLAVRATPRGSEALGYALIIGIANVGVSLSEVIGARLPAALGLGFGTLVLVNAAWIALSAPAVLLLPPEIFGLPPRKAPLGSGAGV